MAKRTKKTSKSRLLKVEALEQRQLLATGFTDAQGQEFSDILHPNGNVYDQVLLKTSAITVINDPGQITRVSFMDLQGDIVQAEFSGAGQFGISLDSFVGPQAADKYIQPGIEYVSGLASFTIQGGDASSNITIFSVGEQTALNKTLFDGTHTGGNNTADVQRITIVADPGNPNGSTFGSINAGNTIFTGSTGVVGITAVDVQVQNKVTVGDIVATGEAIPTLIFGQSSQFGAVTVAGGDLVNAKAINNTNSYDFALNFAAGETSSGTDLPATIPLSQAFTEDNPLADINQTITLTTGVDTVTGGPGHDTFVGTLNQTAGTGTLTTLDSVDGAGGTNTLSITDLDAAGSAMPSGLNVSNVGTINLRAVGPTTFDSTAFTGVTALNVTQATNATLTGASTTAISSSNTTGAVNINGGSSVTVDTAGTGVTIGGTTATTGAISVTHTKQAGNNISINGGSTVGVTASGVTTGTVSIGAGADDPTGAVTVTSTGAAYDAAVGDVVLGAVTVQGGTTVTVNQTASSSTSAAATDASAADRTQSAVTITGTDVTTSVSVTQSAAVTKANAAAGSATTTKETVALTFGALTTGQTTVIDGLTFTASKNLTAAEVAAAFGSLAGGAVQGTGGTGNGIYSGTLNSEWSSGAASGAVVTFTAKDGGPDAEADLVFNAGTVDPTAVVTPGTSTAGAVSGGKMGVIPGTVVVADGGSGSDSLASVSLTNYGVNSTVTSDALTSLTLANANNIDLVVTNNTATTLNLSVNNLTNGSDVNIGGTYTTVNLTATGANSTADLVAAGATTLNVSGDKAVTLSGSTLSALTKLTVSGSAGVTLGDADESDTLTSVDASGTSGAVTVQIDGSKATYAGSSGVDTLTVTTTTVSKAIALGGGNDIVSLATGTSAVTSLDGGDGTDILSMAAADAATVSAAASFETTIANFEKVRLGAIGAATTQTINLANLDDINYVIANGAIDATGALNIDNMASGGTVEFAAANSGTVDVDLTDATGTSDSLNLVLGANAGTVNAAGIEAVNLSVSGSSRTITLQANDATSLTVTGSGSTTITIDNAVTDSIALIDGSAATGAITVIGGTTIAQEIRGGTAGDTLTAGHNSDVLKGNAGADKLSTGGRSLVSLTGGTGNDTFDITGTAVTNVNSYGTIEDLTAGDKIQFNDDASMTFTAAAITLGDTAVFQDYANAAIANTDQGDITWFKFGGNTYVIQHMSADAATSFVNGTDVIVKITGEVNLATASYSLTADTLLIV